LKSASLILSKAGAWKGSLLGPENGFSAAWLWALADIERGQVREIREAEASREIIKRKGRMFRSDVLMCFVKIYLG